MENSRVHPPLFFRRLGRVGLAVAAAATAASWAPSVVQAQPVIVAQAVVAPTEVSSPLTDAAGVLSGAEARELEEALSQFQAEHQKSIYVVYLPSFGGESPQAWTEAAAAARGQNTAVLAVATEDRLFDVYADTSGPDWSAAEVDAMYEAAFTPLTSSDWAEAGLAAVDAAANAGGVSTESVAWLGAGGVALVAAGGGVWAVNRRRQKKASAESLATARALDPADTTSLERLPIETLAERSEEVIVATDESVRRAREELNIAISEFGPERTRPFNKALNEANSALQRAYRTQAELNDAIPETEAQQRVMYTDIISSAGVAERALNEQAEEFSALRNLLINAGPRLDELTQKTVALRSRIEPAKLTLEQLMQDYSSDVLESIDDNVSLAVVSVEEAEKQIAVGREHEAQPAGQQGGLIPAIREAERLIELADSLLAGVEHAESNIAAAEANLSALIQEVTEELEEAEQLQQHGSATGAPADWDTLNEVAGQARQALENARTQAERDPLGAYTALLDADSLLDEKLDAVREKTAGQDRLLKLLEQQQQATAAAMQAAEDLIATRGRIIDAEARTTLAKAQQLHAQSLQIRTKDTREAIAASRRAGQLAEQSLGRARADVRSYQQQVAAQQASSVVGDIARAVVIGQMLSGGGGGGHGGGFGGGGGGRSGRGGYHRGGSF